MIKEEQIIRSRRRSIGLEIRPGGKLVVRAPYHVSRDEIDAFIAEKQDWIASHQDKSRKAAGKALDVTAAEGSRVPFLGKMLKLGYHREKVMRLADSSAEDGDYYKRAENFTAGLPADDSATLLLPHPGLRAKGIQLITPSEEELLSQNRAMMIYWYRMQAKRLLPVRTAYWAQQMGLDYSRIRISSARTNWGSCNAHSGINFSCFLITLCPKSIDYVIVHELSHIRHLDHSKAFYAEVEKVLPDYRERESGIKEDQWVLEIFTV